MKSRILFVAIALALLPAPALAASNGLSDPRAHAGEVKTAVDSDGYVGTRGYRSTTFMVGDSVTRQGITWGFRPLRLAQGWEVSGVAGRDVSTLPYYLADRVAAQQKLTHAGHSRRWRRHHRRLAARLAAHPFRYPLKRVVIALGANATPGWTYGDLRRAINLLPASTVVVLVTPYRDPAKWPTSGLYRVRGSVVATYASWEHRIAEVRPRTCIADWAGFAGRYPWLVPGGVHPNYKGTQAWARIVETAADRCG